MAMTKRPIGTTEDRGASKFTARESLRAADGSWAQALRGHALAPPDPAFARRLRALASAADEEQHACLRAVDAGLAWKPLPGSERAQPPYELRPGTGRRGPARLWERFDAAVRQLNIAGTGDSLAELADAFGAIAEAADAIAEALESDPDAP